MSRTTIRLGANGSKRRVAVVIALLSCGAAIGVGQGLAPGRWELNVVGSLYSLRANEANLSDVVSAIEAAAPADVRLRNLPERNVSGTFDDLALDDLLDRIDIDYLLFYDKGDAPNRVVLERALIGLGEARGVSVARLQKIRELIHNLRDDDVRFNAGRGLSGLRSIGRDSIHALEQALAYGDYQTRQFAAEALYRMLDHQGHTYSPTPRFNEILVEGMKSDSYRIQIANARRGYDYFADRPEEIDRAEAALVRAIYGPDPQQRFLSALLLAQAGKTEYVGRLSEILSPHLADNNLSSDGALAANALYELGPPAWPHLEPLVDSTDPQQAALAKSIIAQGLDPEAGPDPELLARRGFTSRNPVRERVRPVLNGWRTDRFPSHAGP